MTSPITSANNTNIRRRPPKTNQAYSSKLEPLIKKIATSEGRLMLAEELTQLNAKIITERQPERILTKINEALSNGAPKRALTDLFSIIIEHRYIPYGLKKLLLNQIPLREKTEGIYHAFIAASDEADDFEQIKKLFDEMRSRSMLKIHTYILYMRSSARKGLLNETKRAFDDAKKSDCHSDLIYSNYINAIGRSASFDEIERVFKEAQIHSGQKSEYPVVFNAYLQQAGYHNKLEQVVLPIFKQLRDQWIADRATYTTFIKAASLNGRFDLAKEAFDEALEYDYYDVKTFNAYIYCAGKANRFDEVERAFRLAHECKRVDVITYISYMIAAINNREYPKAHQVYKKAQSIYPHNLDIYTSYTNSMAEHNQLDYVHEAYTSAINDDFFEPAIFEFMIYASGTSKNEKVARDAFELSLKQKCADAKVCTRYINAMGECGNFGEAKRGFDALEELEEHDRVSLSRYIKICTKFSQIEEAKRSYEIAKSLKILDSAIVSTYIEAQSTSKSLKDAEDVFKKAVADNLADTPTYNMWLKVLCWNSKLEEALEHFETMIKLDLDDFQSYILMLNMYAFCKKYDQAKAVFKRAKVRKRLDTFLYAAMIHAASIHKDLKTAKELFNEAKDIFPSLKLYNCYLDTLGDLGSTKEVEALFNEIKTKYGSDIYSYSSYIYIMGNRNEMDKAETAFNEARSLGLCDPHLYNSYMDCLRKVGRYDEAMALFHEAFQRGAIDSRSYSCYLNCNPPDLDTFAKEALENNRVDREFYNSLMGIEGKRDNFARVVDLFKLAKRRKKVNEVTYTEFIHQAGKFNRYDLANEAFEEAKALGYKTDRVYNCILQAAKISKRKEDFCKLFEESKSLNIADQFTYSIYMQTAYESENYEEAKAAFEEARKLNKLDPVNYIIYFRVLARLGNSVDLKTAYEEAKSQGKTSNDFFAVYIDSLARISSRLKRENTARNLLSVDENLSLEDIKGAFLEAKKEGIDSEDLLLQYINAAAKQGQFDEAERALAEHYLNGKRTDVIRQSVQNWKIIHTLRPVSNHNKIGFEKCPHSFTRTYPLWLRFNARRKSNIIGSVRVLHGLPQKIRDQVENDQVIVDTTFKKETSLKLKRLFQSFAFDAQTKKTSIEGSFLTGGAVGFCLDKQVYIDSFECCAGTEKDPFFDEDSTKAFDEVYRERFQSEPNDWDFKFNVLTKKPEVVASLPDRLDIELDAQSVMPLSVAKESYSHKQAFINKDGNLFAVRRVVKKEGGAYEFVWGSQFARDNLFLSDANRIPIDRITFKNSKKPIVLEAAQGTVEESAIYCLLKRLKACDPETINEFGFANYFAKLSTGYLGDDEKLEAKAIQTLLNHPDLIYLLESARDNHLHKSTEGALALIFNLCTLLITNGYSVEAEKLVEKAKPLFNKTDNPFFKLLKELWIDRRFAFMEIKAAIEAIALLTHPHYSKIDEHNGKQILQLTVLGYSFILPIDPYNTLKAIEISYNHKEDLIHFIKVLPCTLTTELARTLGFTHEQWKALSELAGLPSSPISNELPVVNSEPEAIRGGWMKSSVNWVLSWMIKR